MKKPVPTPKSSPGEWLVDYFVHPGRTGGRIMRAIKEWFLGIVPELIILAIVVIAASSS